MARRWVRVHPICRRVLAVAAAVAAGAVAPAVSGVPADAAERPAVQVRTAELDRGALRVSALVRVRNGSPARLSFRYHDGGSARTVRAAARVRHGRLRSAIRLPRSGRPPVRAGTLRIKVRGARTLRVAVQSDSTPGAGDRILWVDGDSRAGRCDDSRRASEGAQPDSPLCTIQRAVQVAAAGDTIQVRGGSYPLLLIEGRRQAAYTTIRAQPGERVSVHGIAVYDSSYWRIEGLHVTDITSIEPNPGKADPSKVLHHVALVGNEFTPHGIVAGRAQDLLFENNDIHDLGMERVPNGEGTCHVDPRGSSARAPRCGSGIRISGSDRVLVRANRFAMIPADGMQIAAVRDMTIEGNSFRDVEPFLDPHEHTDSIQVLGATSDLTIRRNTIVTSGGHHGVIAEPLPRGQFAGHVRGLRLENNLFVGRFAMNLLNIEELTVVNNTAWNVSKGLVLRQMPGPGAMQGAVIKNNVLQHFDYQQPSMVAYEDYNLIGTGPRLGSHDLTGEPGFVDPAAENYRLRPGSPGVDTGTGDGAPADDRRGASRDAVPDRGAFEYRP